MPELDVTVADPLKVKMRDIPVGHVARVVDGKYLYLRTRNGAVPLTNSDFVQREPDDFYQDYIDLGPLTIKK